MPVYLFTYHAHGPWMPDNPRGYVHRQRGLEPTDEDMAAAYRGRQTAPTVRFNRAVQTLIVSTARDAGPHIRATVHAVFTEVTHAHVLVSWRHRRAWRSMRTSIRSALSRALNEHLGRRDWFSDSPSRRRVKDHEHFDYLMLVYAVKHKGETWRDGSTLRDCQTRDAKRDVSVTKRRPRRRR